MERTKEPEPADVPEGPPLRAIADAVRRERTRRELSLGELARRAGLSKSTLSQLESGSGNPSVETLWALAVALGVPFARLLETPSQPVRVVRSGHFAPLTSDRAPFTSALLAACPPGARRDLHFVTAEPGAAREAHAHIPGTVEHMLVSAGRWLAGPDGEQVELAPGDYACFPGDRPHTYTALAAGSAAMLVMEYT
ncbi:helix-turn-helix domain-containing protein [Pseudonocardia sp. N23]|uniref:helix-turn-helix domain-containing protein n=1 Tax=Pseudonocardia sp. N23 TaxID=1987376 RepID=UPI000C036909|nr:XRE family transcriptional regulator [Pseudonocardia sp. N23]GAY11662.1 putative DNA-binding protein [Pseudonocardia sp. N23]